MRRPGAAPAIVVAVLLGAACSAPQLAAPPDVTAPPTTAASAPAQPECTSEEAALDPTRSYAPDGPLPGPGEMPSGSTMAAIQERGRLIVGVSADTLQFGARDPITNQIEGFDIDMLKEVATAIFGDADPSRIEYRVITYAQRLPSLEAGDVDLVAHTMTINCNRWLRIGFSSTYYDAGQKVLVGESSGFGSVEDLVAAEARVCVPSGSTNLEELSKPQYAGVELIERPDITDCLVALQQGEADAASGDDTVLVGLAQQDPNLVVVGEAFTSEPYGIGVNADQVDLVRFVNAVLEQVRSSGRWSDLYEQWVGAPAPAPPEPVYGREP
ncbi:MAG: transporter substrate-binding domain-containing protein [Ilumatobacteraceae bacterium]